MKRLNDQIKLGWTVVSCLLLHFALWACSAEEREEAPIVPTTFIDSGKVLWVYVIGDNNLSADLQSDVKEMAEGFKKNAIDGNILIYTDFSDKKPELIRIGYTTDGDVACSVLKTYLEQNSASAEVMSAVLSEMKACLPVSNCGLVLSSHGYGWIPEGVSTRWFGQDKGRHMEISALKDALETLPHFNYILFDACHMGSVETLYTLRGCADYLIASPTEVSSDGFPYEQIMPHLFGASESDCIRMASLYYDHYNALSGMSRSAGVACVKTTSLTSLAQEMHTLVCAHASELANCDASMIQSLDEPPLFYDLEHFVESFATPTEQKSFEEMLKKTIIYKACTPQLLSGSSFLVRRLKDVRHFGGVATYIPQQNREALNSSFQNTEWYEACGWKKTGW